MLTDNNLFQCHFLVYFFFLPLLPASQRQHPVSFVMKFETQEVTESKRSPDYFPTSLYREKAMATHSSALAWRIPWTEEPGGLQSMGSLGVGHN